ncbi:MAG: isoleucine--tRNA ligase [Mycoplasmoidaceae bacterium]|nr:MAG: isoleucine--tRNA ligase [Mycoplasmoidaceae bacterium]
MYYKYNINTMSDFKNTLNIIKTDFEMKANLSSKEPVIQKMWIDKKIYQKILLKNKTKKQKILHDGPPYSNGSLHVGHALNKTLKDIIVRRWNLEGFYSDIIHGWDTHGMPIEHALIKKGINTDPKLTIAQKRDNCRKFAIEQQKIQQNQLVRMGSICDFKKTYRTLDSSFEKHQLEVFAKALEQGLVYQDLKPVFWSWSSQTALAEAEVEYADEQSNSVYVTFAVEKGNKYISTGDKMLVWTTTPWTLPSNQAIAVNPAFIYSKIKVGKETYIACKTLLEKLKTTLEWKSYETICEIKGKDMEGITYKHMLYNMVSPVILADYVADSSGTGLVHNASGFGKDDYLACKKYGIKPYVPIDQYGKFNDDILSIDKELKGVFYIDADKIIIMKLNNANALLKHDVITHSVAHDWRTKKPIMYRATKQWFVNVDKLKSGMVQQLNKVRFPNALNKNQLVDTINNRVEWCISRQRYWGVPITIIYDENGKPIIDKKVLDNIVKIIGKEGSNIWYEKPASYFLPTGYDKKKNYTKETDIMDVWFDSGTTWSVLIENSLKYPAELYIEGKDQFRGWFNSSLICSYIHSKKAPYEQLLGCGYVLDEKGMKMSKSLGNVIDPIKVCEQYGADVLRLWVACSDYSQDVRIGENILKQVSETYRRIRNTLFKFILSNIDDFDINKDEKTCKFAEEDLYILSQLSDNVKKLNTKFYDFNFLQIIDLINNHIIELSSWYFDIIKDVLYCDAPNTPRRRAIQYVLYNIVTQYLFMLAPIIPHTCEEVYSFIKMSNKKESVFLHDHKFEFKFAKKINNKKWIQFFNIRKNAYIKLEQIRENKEIAKNSEASLTIAFSNEFKFTESELAKLLNVAQVKIDTNDKKDEIIVTPKNAKFERCERCWNYFDAKILNNDNICPRCAKAIKK